MHVPLFACTVLYFLKGNPVPSRFNTQLRQRNLRQNRNSKVEGALRAAAVRRKLISRLINYRSTGRLARGDVSVVKRRLLSG